LIVVTLFQALRNRARKAKAARRPNLSDIKPGSVIENIAQTQRLAETALGPTLVPPSSGMEEERPTNTGSGSQVVGSQIAGCHRLQERVFSSSITTPLTGKTFNNNVCEKS
jgi:hypothetical protein